LQIFITIFKLLFDLGDIGSDVYTYFNDIQQDDDIKALLGGNYELIYVAVLCAATVSSLAMLYMRSVNLRKLKGFQTATTKDNGYTASVVDQIGLDVDKYRYKDSLLTCVSFLSEDLPFLFLTGAALNAMENASTNALVSYSFTMFAIGFKLSSFPEALNQQKDLANKEHMRTDNLTKMKEARQTQLDKENTCIIDLEVINKERKDDLELEKEDHEKGSASSECIVLSERKGKELWLWVDKAVVGKSDGWKRFDKASEAITQIEWKPAALNEEKVVQTSAGKQKWCLVWKRRSQRDGANQQPIHELRLIGLSEEAAEGFSDISGAPAVDRDPEFPRLKVQPLKRLLNQKQQVLKDKSEKETSRNLQLINGLNPYELKFDGPVQCKMTVTFNVGDYVKALRSTEISKTRQHGVVVGVVQKEFRVKFIKDGVLELLKKHQLEHAGSRSREVCELYLLSEPNKGMQLRLEEDPHTGNAVVKWFPPPLSNKQPQLWPGHLISEVDGSSVACLGVKQVQEALQNSLGATLTVCEYPQQPPVPLVLTLLEGSLGAKRMQLVYVLLVVPKHFSAMVWDILQYTAAMACMLVEIPMLIVIYLTVLRVEPMLLDFKGKPSEAQVTADKERISDILSAESASADDPDEDDDGSGSDAEENAEDEVKQKLLERSMQQQLKQELEVVKEEVGKLQSEIENEIAQEVESCGLSLEELDDSASILTLILDFMKQVLQYFLKLPSIDLSRPPWMLAGIVPKHFVLLMFDILEKMYKSAKWAIIPLVWYLGQFLCAFLCICMASVVVAVSFIQWLLESFFRASKQVIPCLGSSGSFSLIDIVLPQDRTKTGAERMWSSLIKAFDQIQDVKW
jgi:hypothetical protein